MKKVLLFFVGMLMSISTAYAADQIEHVVERGETLESIAKTYQVTVESLLEANPMAKDMFYTGMILVIPESANMSQVKQNESNSINVSTVQTSTQSESSTMTHVKYDSEEDDDNPGVSFVSMVEFGFLPKVDGAGGSSFSYAITLGANYYFMHHMSGLFAGARIGYQNAYRNIHMKLDRGSYEDLTSDAHFISVPINAGYTFATQNRMLAISPYVGLDVNFCVAAKSKYKQRLYGSSDELEIKLKKKVGIDGRVGAELRIYGFNIGVSYVFPLNDNQKMYFGDDSYAAINVGYGF